MKILFITSNRIGDAVLSTGLLAHLVERFKDAQFTVACGPYARDLFAGVPRLANVFVLEKKSFNRHWLRLWTQIIGTKWDLIVDLRDSVVSRLVMAKKRKGRKRLQGVHKVIENAAILDLNPAPSPHIWINQEAQKKAAQLLPSGRFLLALAPIANWPVKQWPMDRFARLAKRLSASDGPLAGARVVIFGDRSEEAQCGSLIQILGEENVTSIFGIDLLSVAACLEKCQLFVGNDSGLMHIAAAVGIPTLGLFGPGYEEIYGPFGPNCAVVRTPEARHVLLSRLTSLRAQEPNLMQGLETETVLAAAKRLLETAVH